MTLPDTNYSEEELAFSHMDRVAWRKVGCIPGWEPYSWEVVDHKTDVRDIIIKGSIPRLLKTGKRKGKMTWRDNNQCRTVVVTGLEIIAEEAAYSAATGNCSKCKGTCQVTWSWSATEGTKQKECPKCTGTGKVAA